MSDWQERYEPVIGLEMHAELMTQSKMFCGCRVVDSVEAEPNTAVCPVCLGMPGMLPVINEAAVEYALKVALALNCEIQQFNGFERKNYFYPDLPKGYQISQYAAPIGLNGWVDIALENGASKRIRVRRVHMEEDTGKLTHLDNDSGSLVDYNRSGVPLLEIVSEPDIKSGEEARAYASKVRQILRYLDVNSGDMEKGVLRVEPNISIMPIGTFDFGNRTELKNLNSFRVLADGTAYELARQAAVLDRGETVVQETRGWNEAKRRTFSQRVKEDAEDYRYFPEPDLPPLLLDPAFIDQVAASLPELPDAKRSRFITELGLSAYEAGILSDEREVGDWFDSAVAAGGDPKSVANWMINALFGLMNEHKHAISQIKLAPADIVGLIALVDQQTINNNTAKDVLAEMYQTGRPANRIVEEKELAQISDEAALADTVAKIIADNPDTVARYRAGETKLRGFFVGQVMKATKGKANPKLVNDLLSQQL